MTVKMQGTSIRGRLGFIVEEFNTEITWKVIN